MIHKVACGLAALLYLYLGVVLVVAPDIQIRFLGIEPDVGSQLMAMRSGPAFLALAFVFALFGTSGDPAIQRRMAAAGLLNFTAIALVGCWLVFSDRAGWVMLQATAVEAVLAGLFAVAFIRAGRMS